VAGPRLRWRPTRQGQKFWPGASICLKVSEGPGLGLFKGIFRIAQSLPTFSSPTLSLPHFSLSPFLSSTLSLSFSFFTSTLPSYSSPTSSPSSLDLSPSRGPTSKLRSLGTAVGSPSGSGLSLATEQLVVHFELKIVLLLIAILKSFL